MGTGPYAPVTTERCSSDQIECRCSRVSVRRVNRAYNRPRFPLRTAKRLQALWARRWSWTRPRCRSTPSFARRRGRCHCGRGCDCSRRCGSRRGCCCCCCCWRRSSCACRGCSWCWRWRSTTLAEDFHRGQWCEAINIVAA